MIAFLVAVADDARFAAIAAPALAAVREADSPLVVVRPDGPPQPALNAALDELAGAPDLEGVVIVHEDVRLLEPATAAAVRRTFADPDIAVAGVVGAGNVRGLAWWEGTGIGRVITPHHPAREVRGVALAGDVDAVDGVVLCLSPWTVRTLRFDETLAADFHGYDIDLCFQARHHGRRVVVVDLPVEHVHQPLFRDTDAWARNELRFQQQWIDHRMITERRHQLLARGGPARQPG
jgi:hypothetical protein